MKGLIRLWFLSAVLTLCFLGGGGNTSSAFASLVDTTNWTGDLILSIDPTGDGFAVNPEDYPDNFQIVSSGVTLSTTSEYDSVYIYQNVYVPDNAMKLTFNIDWSPSESWELVEASLGGASLLDFTFENGLITADISDRAGTTSCLKFGLQDWDGSFDTLTITDIALVTDPGTSAVPIPGTLPLMAAGLLGLGLFRFWRNN